MIIYANGKYIPHKKLTFDLSDRGLLLGDGIFDTMLYQEKLIYYNDHYKRLNSAAKLLSFNFNLTNEQLKKNY